MLKTILLACLLLLSACATQPNINKSLYERIGDEKVLYRITAETLDKVATDPRTKRSFKNINLKYLKQNFTNFLCVKTGGNCMYEGETMKSAHAQANITTAEFELTVQALRDSMDDNQIGDQEKNELLRILAPMKRDIVQGNK